MLSLALGQSGGTGAADDRARVGPVQHVEPAVQLAVFMAFAAILTNFVSNAAAAAVGTPIAVATAAQLGVPVEPFVLAILFGANLSYATPMAYQTNLLVMSAAGYRFVDFVRVGLPLVLLMLVTLSILLARHYGCDGGRMSRRKPAAADRGAQRRAHAQCGRAACLDSLPQSCRAAYFTWQLDPYRRPNTLWAMRSGWPRAVRKLHVLGHANRQPWPAATRNLADARSRAVRDLLVWLGARPGQVRRVQLPESHGVRAATVSSEPAEQRYVELIAIPGRGPAKQMALPGRARRRIAA